ncbi:MAG: exosortase K [Polyangiales bacterium]
MPKQRVLSLLVTLGIAYSLKAHFSVASAHELRWILFPLQTLVHWFTGVNFVFETEGYVSTEKNFVIAPVCAGVNFLLIVFASLSIGFVDRYIDTIKSLAWIVSSFAFAYVSTVIVNAVRISLSIQSISFGNTNDGLTHQLVGSAIYCMALFGIFALSSKIHDHSRTATSKKRRLFEKSLANAR